MHQYKLETNEGIYVIIWNRSKLFITGLGSHLRKSPLQDVRFQVQESETNRTSHHFTHSLFRFRCHQLDEFDFSSASSNGDGCGRLGPHQSRPRRGNAQPPARSQSVTQVTIFNEMLFSLENHITRIHRKWKR